MTYFEGNTGFYDDVFFDRNIRPMKFKKGMLEHRLIYTFKQNLAHLFLSNADRFVAFNICAS